MEFDQPSQCMIGCAIEVQHELGLLESAYEQCLATDGCPRSVIPLAALGLTPLQITLLTALEDSITLGLSTQEVRVLVVG